MSEDFNDSADGYSVRVIARVRPLNDFEHSQGAHQCVSVSDDRPSVMQVAAPGPGGRAATKEFAFDYCISTHSSQEDFFNNSGVSALLDSALDG